MACKVNVRLHSIVAEVFMFAGGRWKSDSLIQRPIAHAIT